MNFKFNLAKDLFSLVISIAASVIIIGRTCICFTDGICWNCILWIFAGIVVCFLVLHVIFSLFQKKK